MCDCDLKLENGRCNKYGCKYKCEPSSINWFDDNMEVIEIDQVCRKSSIFGNYFYAITKKQIEALLAGKVLYDCDEYGMFIALKPETEE